ncbi:MAG: helix-turn-helix domain-containing protein [Ruminococcaceae bacterium]|nr:helix-turn-helix domain-containing protein [Oscillospiraceae bacterium]
MHHFPLVDSSDFNTRIEFSHIALDQKKGAWKKENNIILDHIKINVFVSGEFSFFVDGVTHHPVCGDICVLPPYKMHCGQILKPTHTNYFQIDLGVHALDMVPGGKKLIDELAQKNARNTFSHPKGKMGNEIIELCSRIERAILKEDYALAFSFLIELLSKINSATSSKGAVCATTLSKATLDAIKEIENNYESEITLFSLSKHLKISPSYLSRLFKNEVGIGAHEYLTQYRILMASQLLKDNSVTEVGYMCGFNDTSHFISVFKKRIGITPKEYKNTLNDNSK